VQPELAILLTVSGLVNVVIMPLATVVEVVEVVELVDVVVEFGFPPPFPLTWLARATELTSELVTTTIAAIRVNRRSDATAFFDVASIVIPPACNPNATSLHFTS
jgi:hypothetical protein